MKKFKPFRNYLCRFPTNYDNKFIVEIVGRTKHFVKFKVPSMFKNEVKRAKVAEYDGHETFFPLGHYSMAPICKSSKMTQE